MEQGLSFRLDGRAPLAAGASSRVYRMEEGRVLKLFHGAVSEEMIARECAAATIAADAGIPVARPLARGEADGLRAVLYPEISGATLLRRMRGQPLRSGAYLRQMAGLQRQIHGCAAPGLRSLRQVLRTDILHGPADPTTQRAVLALLDALPDGDALLHGDFHVSNILMAADGPVAIDWSKAAQGAPTADLLRTEMLLRFGEGPQDWLTNRARDWAASTYVSHYRAIGADGIDHVAGWRAVVALAWLRARAPMPVPVRQRAFLAYLNRALAQAGLAVRAG